MDALTMQDGWTQIPNEILEHLDELGNAELRVLLVVYRKTIGYRKDTDVISFSQFETMTGLGRQHVKTAIESLLARNFLTRTDAKRASFSYQLVTLGNQSPKVTSNPKLPEPVTLGNQSLVTLGSTQKKEKETIKESVGASAPTAPIRKPRKPKPEPATELKPVSDHTRLMGEYAQSLGYQIPNGSKEAAGAKRLLSAGYTVEQVIDVYCQLKARPFWRDKHLSLHNVYQDIGAILNHTATQQKPYTNGTYAPVPPERDDIEYASAEEWAEALAPYQKRRAVSP